jgi:hypothetical protein
VVADRQVAGHLEGRLAQQAAVDLAIRGLVVDVAAFADAAVLQPH